MLIDGLPQDSATHTALRDAGGVVELGKREWDGRHGRWSHEATLLARLIDEVGYLRAETLQAHGAKAQYPEPMYRPGVEPAKPKRRSSPEQTALLLRLRESRRAVG